MEPLTPRKEEHEVVFVEFRVALKGKRRKPASAGAGMSSSPEMTSVSCMKYSLDSVKV